MIRILTDFLIFALFVSIRQICVISVQKNLLNLSLNLQRRGSLRAPSGHNFYKPFILLDNLFQGHSSKERHYPTGLPVIAEQGGMPALRETARHRRDPEWWP